MADDPNAPWAWIPDSWRDAGTAIADSLHNAASNNALTSLGLAPIAPQPPSDAPSDAPPLAAYPSLQGPAPVPPPVDDSLAGAPQGTAPVAAPTPAMNAPSSAPAIPPPFDSALTGAPGAPAFTQMPTLPPASAPMYPPMAMPHVPPGAPRSPAELDPTSPEAWNAAQNAEIARLATEDPIAFAAEQAKHEQAAKDSIAADQLNAARQNRMRAEQDWTDYQKATADSQAQMQQVVTDAQELAKRQVDPDPRSTFSKIRGVLAAFVGGLVAPYNGGRNVGLEAIQKEIEQGVAAQQTEIQNQWKSIDLRKGAATEGLTRANDLYRTGETARLSLWQAAINDLQTKQAQYDPRGTAAMNIASAIQGARAKQADIQIRLQENLTKQQLEIVKASREQQEFIDKQRHEREEEAVSRQNAATSATTAYTGLLSQRETAANNVRVDKRETLKSAAEIAKDAHKEGREDTKDMRERAVSGIAIDDKGNIAPENAKGATPLAAPTPEEAKALRTQKAGVDSVNQMINQIVRGIDKYGGANKYTESAEFQRDFANKEALLFALHSAYGVEGFRPGVLEQMEQALGGGDITSYIRSAAPGLRAAKDALNANFTNRLRAADPNFKGTYEPTDTSAPATINSVNQAYQDAFQAKTPLEVSESQKVSKARAAVEYATGGGLLYNGPDERREISENAGDGRGFSVDQGKAVDLLLQAYKGEGAESKEAAQRLADLAKSKRDSLAFATIGVLRTEAPDLYKSLIPKLSKERRAAVEAFDKAVAAGPNAGPNTGPNTGPSSGPITVPEAEAEKLHDALGGD